MKLFNHHTFTRLAAASLLTACIWIAGCETMDEEGANNTLQITPSYASLKKNQSVTLSASGGANYRWEVENPEMGTINTTVGRSVVYTAREVPEPNGKFSQKIILRGTTDLDTSGDATGTATIAHVPANEDPDSVSVSGGDTAIVGGQAISISVSGGDGKNYSWTLSNGSYGRLSSSSGSKAAYYATSRPGFVQTLRISSGKQTQTHLITHLSGETGISIIGPNLATVGGQAITLTVSGGDGKNYTWSLSNGSAGSLSSTSGNKVTYRAVSAPKATQTIRVTSGGQTQTHLISHQSGETGISITGPNSATVGGTAVSLTASGGDGRNYTWSLSNSSAGVLSSTSGNKVTYRATAAPRATQTIRVVSGSQSQTFPIVHQSAIVNVSISASSSEAPVGGRPVTLTASGGDGVNYTWSISNGNIGYLSGNSGRQVTYRASTSVNATQTIRVSSGGKTFQITIIHVPQS